MVAVRLTDRPESSAALLTLRLCAESISLALPALRLNERKGNNIGAFSALDGDRAA
jgi:hypothetical protein